MIYISSSSVKSKKIKDSVQQLVNHGFRNIELSGGTELYDCFESDLLKLQEEYELNYLCHNYFPPPADHFVLNLASLNEDVFQKSYQHIKTSIDLSKRLGATKFAFHAGFFIDVQPKQIGKKISRTVLFDKEKSLQRFVSAYDELQEYAKDIELYIENNVYSSTNFHTFKGENIFMLTNYEDYIDLKERIDFNLLLDVAHLKVSSNSLGLDFKHQLSSLIALTDYLHISDNDSYHDENNPISLDSDFLNYLSNLGSKKMSFTLEVYDSIEKILESQDILKSTLN